MPGKVIPFSATNQEVHPEHGMAKPFFQTWLDDVAGAVMSGDFGTYAACIELPLTFKTDGGVMIVRDLDALKEGFDAWRKMLQTNKVTDFIRTPIEAAWTKDKVFTGLYETSMSAGGRQIMPVFTSLMELTLIDGIWKTTTLINGMQNVEWPIKAPFLVVDGDPDP